MTLTAAVTTACIAFLGYRLLWRRFHQLSSWSGVDAHSVTGTITGGQRGLLILATEDGEQLAIATHDAKVVAWPGPGAWRISRGLCVGDPVTLLVMGNSDDLSAIRIIRGRWPAPPWPRVPSAVVAILLGIALLQVMRGAQVEVEREIREPAASSFLLDTPDAMRIYSATRRMGAAHFWAGEKDGRRTPRGQTFLDYVGATPRVANAEQRFFYLQPIGSFEQPRQKQILGLTARFLARFYCLPVRVAHELPLSEIPDSARRLHPETAHLQLQSTHLIHDLLRWRRPRQAAAYLGITPEDIWPGPGWEAVYGQASLIKRVGVLSTYRHGGPESQFRLALVRTLKVAAHESGHMFSIKHCGNHGCLMSGHNDREEADRRFPVLCPDCLAKVLWATRCEPVQRYSRLAGFCWKHKLKAEAEVYARLLNAAVQAWGDPDRLAVSY